MKSIYDFDSDYDWYDYLAGLPGERPEDDPDYQEARAEREAEKMEDEAWDHDGWY